MNHSPFASCFRFFYIIVLLLLTTTSAAQPSAVIPQPVTYINKVGAFNLHQLSSIHIDNDTFRQNAEYLLREILPSSPSIEISRSSKAGPYTFSFITVNTLDNEEYQLSISPENITVNASGPSGSFYAIQTLHQLMADDGTIPACVIHDKPAFPIRGYMVDVGRNYLSLPLIKKQIDVMAQYKLNAFHMHLTEDIAWRIQCNRYPSLHAPENMLRNKGMYYTYAELNELAAYCKERSIHFIPEIDMPGHSNAFKRATGFDMQSPEGKKILLQILQEFFTHVPTAYFHVGGDEVVYQDKHFLADICTYILSKGKKVIAWDPGGETGRDVIKQLWNGTRTPPSDRPSVDSRHLYLNHFDPLEGVVSIFNHSVLDTTQGSRLRLGAILCNWPDRRVEMEDDVIRMNAVYPCLITFGERTWAGGGFGVLDANMHWPGTARYEQFNAFEKKLLDHKKRFFAGLPFPYQQQTDIEWKMAGPFDNKGDVTRSFAPEQQEYWDTVQPKENRSVWGGTIWLRHFWDPVVQSHLKHTQDSTTWYAYRTIYADTAGYYPFWIGFNNIGRSPKSPTPKAGTWDNKGSKALVNGLEIPAPNWKYAGRVPHDLEEPLYDEGYEYRAPTRIYLRKGLNDILLKLPVQSFYSTYDMPVKWMFTFVAVRD